MRMRVLRVATFESDQEFIQWQADNAKEIQGLFVTYLEEASIDTKPEETSEVKEEI